MCVCVCVCVCPTRTGFKPIGPIAPNWIPGSSREGGGGGGGGGVCVCVCVCGGGGGGALWSSQVKLPSPRAKRVWACHTSDIKRTIFCSLSVQRCMYIYVCSNGSGDVLVSYPRYPHIMENGLKIQIPETLEMHANIYLYYL